MDRPGSLRVLSIAYYVYAGFSILAGIAVLVVFELLWRPNLQGSGKDAQEMSRMCAVMWPIFGFTFVLIAAKAVLCLVAARAIARRRRRTLCLVNGCISLVDMPIGTVIGIFTLILLNDPATRAEFDGPPVFPARAAM